MLCGLKTLCGLKSESPENLVSKAFGASLFPAMGRGLEPLTSDVTGRRSNQLN